MLDDELIGVAAAAERHHCSTQTIRRHIREGSLPARTAKVRGRDGRPVVKTLIAVCDLDDAFGWTAHELHVQKIRDTPQPLTEDQKSAIRKIYLAHLRDRDARRRGVGDPGTA